MSAADASSLSLWSALSLIGFLLVIFGVVLEGAEAFIWVRSWLLRKRLLIIWNMLPAPHIPRWAHRLDHVGWFILVIGLALETWGHIRVTDITDRENRRLTAQLDSTTKSAASNELQVAELTSNNLVLHTRLLETSNRLEETENFAARIRINLITPRSWSFDDKKFIADLKEKPKGSVAICVFPNDGDTLVLAVKFEEALKQVGWSVSEPKPIDAETLVKRPELATGISTISKEEFDLRTSMVEKPKIKPDGSINTMDLYKTDTPTRALWAAMADCGIFSSLRIVDQALPENTVLVVFGKLMW